MEQADSLRELLHRPRVFRARLHRSIRLVDRRGCRDTSKPESDFKPDR